MSNYVIQVDFFGNNVRAETDGNLVSLTDLVRAGNQWRATKGFSLKTLQSIVESVGFNEFLKVAQSKNTDKEILFTTGKGNQKRTMAHVIIAIYVAEQMSPEFHYEVINKFIEGKLLEFRELGGTEFKNLNAAIDLYLSGREGKSSNQGLYINIAKIIREKLMGAGSEAGCWDSATVAQIHSRYDLEHRLIDYLKRGFIRDWEHLKQIAAEI